MANVKISALPATTTSTIDDYFVKNNSGQTITNKVKIKDALGLTVGTQTDSIKSASFLSSIPATSTGIGSVAIGADSEGNADYATAVGYRAEVFDAVRVQGTAIGYATRVAQYSTAIGNNNTAVGAYSVSLGSGNQVAGGQDVGIGQNVRSYVQYGIAIGYDSQVTAGTGGIAIGNSPDVTATDAVAIGTNALASHDRSVVLGNGQVSTYTGTTHVKNLHINGQMSFDTNTLNGLSAFTINFDICGVYDINLSQNATINFTNFRDGGIYYVIIENQGTYNFTAATATGGTLFFDGGGRSNITHNSYDLWQINCIGSYLFVTQYKNYTI